MIIYGDSSVHLTTHWLAPALVPLHGTSKHAYKAIKLHDKYVVCSITYH